MCKNVSQTNIGNATQGQIASRCFCDTLGRYSFLFLLDHQYDVLLLDHSCCLFHFVSFENKNNNWVRMPHLQHLVTVLICSSSNGVWYQRNCQQYEHFSKFMEATYSINFESSILVVPETTRHKFSWYWFLSASAIIWCIRIGSASPKSQILQSRCMNLNMLSDPLLRSFEIKLNIRRRECCHLLSSLCLFRWSWHVHHFHMNGDGGVF